MKELSLNVLDLAQNSIDAGADLIYIELTEDESGLLTLSIRDNGHGIEENALGKVTDPFYTTHTIRKVGMGIPLLKLAAEQAGGELTVVSKTRESDPVSHGTEVKATFCTDSIDFTPVGDMAATLCVLIQGHPDISYVFRHKTPELDVSLDTSEMREVLGEGISLGEPEILEWIAGYLRQQYNNE